MAKALTFDDVAAIAGALPGVVEGSSYGTRGWKAGKKLIAREKEKMDAVLVLKLASVDEQEFLIESAPDVFFITDHYKGWPAVLLRLKKVRKSELAAMIERTWRREATKKMLAAYEG